MFSKSCEYAIRAVVFISSRKNESPIVKINEIAESVEAPAYYTSKILQQLVKQKIIGSMKGQNGGFYIDENLKEIRLIDIVNAIDGDSIFNGCGLGLKSCSETNPCPLHDRFKKIRSDIKDMLLKTKISDLSENYLNGKSTLKKPIGKLDNRTQIARMVSLFYATIRSHEVLAPLFSKIIDWELHQERMTAFWSFVLLDQEGYSGSPIEKHFNLGIEPQHFQLWLEVFNTVLDENFEGEMVEKAKKRAEGIASMLNYKLSKNDGKLISKAN